MAEKTSDKILFDVRLNLVADKKGVLTTKESDDIIYVTTPPVFGGEEKLWSPEHLLLGAISSCFMTTYLVFAKKFQFETAHFECNSKGQIEIVEGRYKFTHIHVYPKVYVADETLLEKANLAMEKTQKYCLISNSVNASIYYHSEVHCESIPETNKKYFGQSKTSFSLDEARKIGDRLGIDFAKFSLHELGEDWKWNWNTEKR